MHDELRPDKCGVVLAPRTHPHFGWLLVAMVEKANWDRVRKPRMRQFLINVQSFGYKVFVIDGNDQKQMLRDGTLAPAPRFIDIAMI